MPWSFTLESKRLAFFELDPVTHFDIWTVPIECQGDELIAGRPEPFLRTNASEVFPSFSPDGRWIAYGSNASGSFQIYVRAFPDNGTAVQVSRAAGMIPFWASNGHELLYRTDQHRLMVARYRVRGGVFEAEAPTPWSESELADTGFIANFDLAPGAKTGAGFLPQPTPGEESSSSQVTVITNFFELLRK